MNKTTYTFTCSICGYTIVYHTDMKVVAPKECPKRRCKGKMKEKKEG